MKKILKGCIGIFIFILALFIYNDVVFATHPNCSSTTCSKYTIESYICPNSGSSDDDSAIACITGLMSGDTTGMTLLDENSNVPLKYNDSN